MSRTDERVARAALLGARLGCLAALLRQYPSPRSRHQQRFGLLQRRQTVLFSLHWSVIAPTTDAFRFRCNLKAPFFLIGMRQ